jgi:hypothetical protein
MTMKFKHTGKHKFNFVLILLPSVWAVGCGLFDSGSEEPVTCANAVIEEWTYLGLGDEIVQTIAINPGNSAHIMVGTSQDFSAGTQGKIFRSTDCGNTWQQVWEGGSVSRVVFDPKDPEIVYASPHGMIRSEDGGKTWAIIDEGLAPYLNFTQRVTSVAVDPQDPRRIYSSTAGFGAGWLFYSDNRGNNWHPVPGRGDLERNIDDNRALNNGIGSPILINPSNTDELFVSTSINFDFLQSMDRGNSWYRKAFHDSGNPVHPIVFDPSNTTIYGMVRHFEGYFEGGLFQYNLFDDTWDIRPVPDNLEYNTVALGFLASTGSLAVGYGGGVYIREAENSWVSITDNLSDGYVRSMHVYGDLIYVGLSPNNTTYDNGGLYVRSHN